MNYIQRMELWGETHHPRWMDIVRIALGIFLCYKGIEFLQDMSEVLGVMSSKMSFGSFTLVLIGHYIAFAHLLGGFLIALGLITRIACIAQIPVIVGAIIFINAPEGLWQPFSDIWLSLIVLALLVYFLIAGDGKWSFSWIAEQQKEK